MPSLLTLSPSEKVCLGSARRQDAPQTTPKLPRRERLASFCRLLGNENFSEFSKKTRNGISQSSHSTIDIKISPCRGDQLESADGLLALSKLPFSPRLLSSTPCKYSPTTKVFSLERSPLYAPDNQKCFLGRGSFGNVSLCTYKGSKFALKIVCHPSQPVGETNLLGIRHPHLIEIFNVSGSLERTFVCMEFGGNCNLQHILNTKSELDFPRKLSFCFQVSSGLQHCHQNRIVHGDVKPANVIVDPRGVCKLGDFGLSFRVDSLRAPSDKGVGTVAYSAPEVLRGSSPTFLSDVYSFGVLLCQMHSRETPFAGEHPHVVIYKVVHYGARPRFAAFENSTEESFADIAVSCWCSQPTDRLSSSDVRSQLQKLLKDLNNRASEGNDKLC